MQGFVDVDFLLCPFALTLLDHPLLLLPRHNCRTHINLLFYGSVILRGEHRVNKVLKLGCLVARLLHVFRAISHTQVPVAFHFRDVGPLLTIVGEDAVVFHVGDAFGGWGRVEILAETVDEGVGFLFYFLENSICLLSQF